jgi:hypothetical protein
MKARYFVCMFLALFLFTGIASIGFAQSSNCVVMEKQGNLVTVACPGEGTQVINMGGTADIYKPGDTVTVTGQPNKNREVGPKVR